jgi:hypothetical protein
MILGIASLGEGERPIEQRLRLWVAHSVGGTVGGALAALLIWLVLTPVRTMLPGVVGLVLVSLVAAYAVLADLGKVRFRRPSTQVPQTWYARYGPERAYFFYGGALGAGLVTYVPYGLAYSVFAALGLLLPLPAALAAGALFGLARTIPTGPGSLSAEWASRVLFRSPVSHRIFARLSVAATLALVALLLAAQL